MKNNRILNFLLIILQLFMQVCVAVTLVNLLLHGFMHYTTFHAFNTFYISIPMVIYYFTKSYVKNGKIAFLIHMVALFSTIVIPKGPAEEVGMIFVPAVLFCVYSLKRSNEKPILPFELGIILGCYIFGGSMPSESALVIPFYAAVLYIVSYAIWYNINNLNAFVIENGEVKSFNAEQAVNVNTVLLSLFIVACVAGMILLPVLHVQDLINGGLAFVWSGVVRILQIWGYSLPSGGAELEQSLENKPPIQLDDEVGFDFEMTEGSAVLNWAAAIFAAVIFVSMIILLIHALKDIRYRKSQGLDVKEFVKPNLRKKTESKPKEKRTFFWNVPNDMMIRKMYHKTIRKNLAKGQKVEGSLAPSQITEKVMGWNDDSKKMTELYEKARYSGEEITKEEISLFQKSIMTK